MEATDWKAKSMQRTKENKSLKKRVKEVTDSRDNWKSKAIDYKTQVDKLSADLKKIKNKLNEIIK